MPTLKKRINVSLPDDVEQALNILAKRDDMPQATKALHLIKLAIDENKKSRPEYVIILKEIRGYYRNSTRSDEGDNRHSVAHGYMHPRFWSKESFEELIHDIARISKFASF